jgi:site-specific recombinase XerD
VKKADVRYWILMLAHMNKNGKATAFPVGQELTQAYDTYLGSIRPRLLAGKSHDYVFCKQSGDAPGPTFDFSDWTRGVCKELIGRPVNCHAFRSALVTTYYYHGLPHSHRPYLLLYHHGLSPSVPLLFLLPLPSLFSFFLY